MPKSSVAILRPRSAAPDNIELGVITHGLLLILRSYEISVNHLVTIYDMGATASVKDVQDDEVYLSSEECSALVGSRYDDRVFKFLRESNGKVPHSRALDWKKAEYDVYFMHDLNFDGVDRHVVVNRVTDALKIHGILSSSRNYGKSTIITSNLSKPTYLYFSRTILPRCRREYIEISTCWTFSHR